MEKSTYNEKTKQIDLFFEDSKKDKFCEDDNKNESNISLNGPQIIQESNTAKVIYMQRQSNDMVEIYRDILNRTMK